MNVPLVDLNAQYRSLKAEIDSAIQRVVDSTQFVLGPEVKALEGEMAAYVGVKHAIGVASGTDALHLALLACGIGPGDEVITTPFTFIATAEVITNSGATPVFVDIDPDTLNIDPARIESRITRKTRAILPVHLYGQSADMDPILEIARKHGLKVIEDCAQALGAKYKGKQVGALGDAGCLSFFPSKILGAYGDGGMVVTNDAALAKKVDMLHNHGTTEKYYHTVPGFNSRLDSVQAAVLRVKLKHIDEYISRRRQNASLYAGMLAGVAGIELLAEAPYAAHVFNYYTLRARQGRDQLQKFLTTQGVATAVYYPLSLHLQEVYRDLKYRSGDLPRSEAAQAEALSLPMYPELDKRQIATVTAAIKDFCRRPVE